MTALPTLKLRVLPIFPSAVFGSGAITVTKVAGVYTISFSISVFGSVTPPAADYPTDFLLAYNSTTSAFFKVALSNLGVGGQRVQRSVTASPIAVAATDQIINFNINAGSPACTLPASSTRNGVPLTFKDAGGHAAAHALTISAAGSETIDGLASVPINTNFQQLTFTPYNDGTNSGWALS